MKTTFIYTLKDPRNNKIRYVGKSNNPRKRLSGHVTRARNKNVKSYKNNWVKSLLKEGLKPIVEILDEVPRDSWQIYEKYWISQFRCWGFNLTNLSDGGEGTCGYKFTEEQKQKIRKPKSCTKNMRKPKSEEHKKAMSKAFKGRKLSPETIDKIKNSMKDNPLVIETNKRIGELHKITVYQYDKHNILMKKWDSFREAAEFNDIQESHISECVSGKRKSTGGFIWSKEKLTESDFILSNLKLKVNNLWIDKREKLDFSEILNLVCESFGIESEQIYKKTTSKKKLIPKYYLTYFLFNILDMSYEDIDKELNTNRTSTYKNRFHINSEILFELSNKIEETI